VIEEMKNMVVRDEPGRRVFRCTQCDGIFAEDPWPRSIVDHPQDCWNCGVTDDLQDDDSEDD
jgi:hypothetical protein